MSPGAEAFHGFVISQSAWQASQKPGTWGKDVIALYCFLFISFHRSGDDNNFTLPHQSYAHADTPKSQNDKLKLYRQGLNTLSTNTLWYNS